jgi:hypothetical protein
MLRPSTSAFAPNSMRLGSPRRNLMSSGSGDMGDHPGAVPTVVSYVRALRP